MKRLAYLSILPILGAVFMAFSVEKVVKYQVAKSPDEKYFKVIKKPDIEVNNEVKVENGKAISNLTYGNNRVAISLNPNDVSAGSIDVVAKYLKNIGYDLDIGIFMSTDKKKIERYDKIHLVLKENKENKKKYRNNKRDIKSDLPSKFTFDLNKMRTKGKGLDYIITILADRNTGEHFVAPLAPPPPPPPAPIKGKTKLSMNTFEGKQGLTNLTFDAGKMRIPKNFTEIKRGVYLKDEVTTNNDYKNFLDFVNNDTYFSKKYAKSMIPDYWGNVKNMNKPATFVSWDQATEFCKWKTEISAYQMFNKRVTNFASILKENSKLRKKFKFRLPTEIEWESGTKKLPNHPTIGIGFRYVLDLT